MNQLQEHNLTKTIVVSEENYENLNDLALCVSHSMMS